MFVSGLGAVIEGNVFALLIESELGRRRQTLEQGRLAVKLMRELSRFEHGLRVRTCCLTESGIEGEFRRSRLLARLVRQCEKLLFGLNLGTVEGDVGSRRGRGLQRGSLAGLSGLS